MLENFLPEITLFETFIEGIKFSSSKVIYLISFLLLTNVALLSLQE